MTVAEGWVTPERVADVLSAALEVKHPTTPIEQAARRDGFAEAVARRVTEKEEL